ncbi:putative two-component response regulatory protein [Bradyrhizobium sp. STM 3843]|uniref:response regulator n=1 Tax=Bradyrhizobium sp. STM 3843 TaxID=551947 RepID=UPI0002403785|nr:response regulator [Bradyrhizobium sp. STM 3843]CCE07789.1 putative two-component response regulatory protein [Bradyrhizobium sp. STM 3843]
MPRILVVDDQKDVRAMISMVLRVNHFDVVEAASASAGLQVFRETPCDAAIVDVFLGDANGLDLVARLREIVPDLPVVAVSGMTAFDGAALSEELTRVVYLQKPFRPAELMHAVAAARTAVAQPDANGTTIAASA